MSIDFDEIKRERIKRDKIFQEVQNYLETQDALEQENATGKMGSRTVKRLELNEKVSGVLGRTSFSG